MNYKYISQLLERYWDAQTTLEEERILKSFFSQDDIPDELKRYAPLFASFNEAGEEHLGEDFDEQILSEIGLEKKEQSSRLVSLTHQISPLMKAAAVIAVMLTVGNVAQRVAHHNSDGMIQKTTDTYIRTEEISAKIKVIDEIKKEAIAQADSTFRGDGEKSQITEKIVDPEYTKPLITE